MERKNKNKKWKEIGNKTNERSATEGNISCDKGVRDIKYWLETGL